VGSVLDGVVPGMVDGVDPLAFFGCDVDECVEAEEGGTRVGVEEGEEGGGGVGVVEEGVDGAGTRGRRRVAEERGDVHAAGGHGGRNRDGLHIRLHMYNETLRWIHTKDHQGRPRTHRTQVPSVPLQPINGLKVLDRPRPRRGTGRRRDAFKAITPAS
jgi:hypothetical protein